MVVGIALSAFVGSVLGKKGGITVGVIECSTVGFVVGLELGTFVGSWVKVCVGMPDCSIVG